MAALSSIDMKSRAAGKVDSQGRACEQVLEEVLYEALLKRRPADRALADCFKRNRQYGARDRRLLTESVFSVFRWWGWLRSLLSNQARQALAPGELNRRMTEGGVDSEKHSRLRSHNTPRPCLFRDDAVRLLLGAWVLDNPQDLPLAADVWTESLELAEIQVRKICRRPKAETRFNEYSQALGLHMQPATWDCLLPEWARSELAKWALPELDEKEFLRRLQQRPPVWIRAQKKWNARALAAALEKCGVETELHPRLPQALRVTTRKVSLYAVEPFRQGAFEIQDLASQLIGLVCRPEAGQRWWDCCAGAGGKSLQLADLMGGSGTVVASDIRAGKLADLQRRARRGGYDNIITRAWKGKPIPRKASTFHGVLVDAPCTCSGTWRRNPDRRWAVLPSELESRTKLQLRLLRAAASGVAPDGVLVYATCSWFQPENQGVVEQFLASNPHFSLEPFTHPLTGAKTDGTMQVWPGDGDCDAVFAARMRKT